MTYNQKTKPILLIMISSWIFYIAINSYGKGYSFSDVIGFYLVSSVVVIPFLIIPIYMMIRSLVQDSMVDASPLTEEEITRLHWYGCGGITKRTTEEELLSYILSVDKYSYGGEYFGRALAFYKFEECFRGGLTYKNKDLISIRNREKDKIKLLSMTS